MKGRESGMPDEAWWATFFEPDGALDRLFGADGPQGDIVEFGCGYGTFTLPAARRTGGVVTALDIEPDMVERVVRQAAASNRDNVRASVRDFVAHGTGLDDASQDHAMIFNLLHLEDPLALLREARRNLRPDGTLSVVHWRSDIPTPRGPSLDIRPTPAQCRRWMQEAGFEDIRGIDLQRACPYHFALIARR
jgi:SAM-dependent methyltransferase